MKVFLAAIVAMIAIAFVSQAVLTHVLGKSSEVAYSDRSARPD